VRRALFGVGLRAACRGMLRRVSFHPPPGIAASDPFDVDRGIDTAGFCSWRVLDSGQTSDPYNAGYLPAEPAAVRVLLSCVRNPTAYTFLDLGCGKGRVLALAAEAGFQRIIGVEINPALAAIAQQNATRLGGSAEIEIWNMDAADVSLPREPLALFLNHPFWRPVMKRVVDNLERSLIEAPRPLFVLYVNPVLAEMFEQISKLERIHEGAEGMLWRARSAR
jgi:SAM-dependent methyltransferase